ncbi:DNA repair RAD52-like protein 2, chloroplastic [Euphorbia lathyris]|uniref:DNA repair RAD52-like protein 2, chloroplastic n=1 Tax=Euphorbia lathyris TaxID=212925 RepID=UPI003313DAF6
MALPNSSVFLAKSVSPVVVDFPLSSSEMSTISFDYSGVGVGLWNNQRRRSTRLLCAVAGSSNNNANSSSSGGGSDGDKKKGVLNSNYVVPLDKSFSSSYSSCITRPLAEILRDLNKRIPDNIIKPSSPATTLIPWYHANRMLSFYAPGWCGEIRDVIFSDNGSVSVVYRVTVRGSDGEAHRESIGTVSPSDGNIVDPVAAAEEIAFCRACARFGLGLYLYHEE